MDLIKRARSLSPDLYGGLAHEMADEIERLRAALRKIADDPYTDDEGLQKIARDALKGKTTSGSEK